MQVAVKINDKLIYLYDSYLQRSQHLAMQLHAAMFKLRFHLSGKLEYEISFLIINAYYLTGIPNVDHSRISGNL
jgi:hypothetical protein